ncbi:uncharacterized protein DUF4190 [Luteimonas cucumeris]|uniref:Uncharacterized protein DUF4190 n=1 Tax=Luteimonas cucumeris TaxID=985012 RepID=A0A562L7D2_9GAMM|nr:DUF4190 domain-containing protein [Luteimonas cucumeris]TWI03538.1 uncharacterized protein DUF4190 [Luteimonas cucumeris]
MSTPIRQTSTLAIISLIAGILGWTALPLIGSIGAIITGHMARGEINREPQRLEGDALAVAGLVLGYTAIVVGILALFVFVLFFGGMVWLGLQS